MSDSVLKRYAKPGSQNADPTALALVETDPDEIDDCGVFGYLRGVRDRAVMIELRKKDGNVRAFGYAWLAQVDFDPSAGITLYLGGQKVRIRGRNLNTEIRPHLRLFEGILRHRVPWLQEMDEPALMRAGEGETVIEKIEW
jgi:hypothetical protein